MLAENGPRSVSVLVLVAVVLAVTAALATAQESATVPARASVDAWLALVDNGNYAASWDQAAGGFKNIIPVETWSTAVAGVRGPLGPVKSRALKSATTTTTVPGGPDGEYVIFQFNTTFDQKASSVETVTAAKEKDGIWRVAGYFVR